jgi:hypothetical protein
MSIDAMSRASRASLLRTVVALTGVFWATSAAADGNGKCHPQPDCNTVQTICYASLDLDPITCGMYYGCCYGNEGPPVGDHDCRNSQCDPGCPSDICAQSSGLTIGSTFSTDLAVGAAGSTKFAVEAGTDKQGHIFYNWWNLGQGARGWREIEGGGTTHATPAIALVGKYAFVAIRGTDGSIYLNQGDVNKPFVGWRTMNFQSPYAPGAASSGKLTAVVAANPHGTVAYNWWSLGQGGKGWQTLDGRATNAAPAAALVGNYMFVVVKGTDGSLYLNQGGLGKKMVGWKPMGFQSDVAPAMASSGDVSVVVAKDRQGRVFYNYWRIGQGGHWVELPGMQTNLAPAAALVGDYLFVMAHGRDGKMRLNQGTLGKTFVGWR